MRGSLWFQAKWKIKLKYFAKNINKSILGNFHYITNFDNFGFVEVHILEKIAILSWVIIKVIIFYTNLNFENLSGFFII